MTVPNSPVPLNLSMQPTNERPFSQVSWDEVLQASPKTDLINKPPHYTVGKYEVIDVIEDWKLGFRLANVVKYVARAEHKGNPISDLYKALWYLNREIANRERNA